MAAALNALTWINENLPFTAQAVAIDPKVTLNAKLGDDLLRLATLKSGAPHTLQSVQLQAVQGDRTGDSTCLNQA
jgi:hypothetical protein